MKYVLDKSKELRKSIVIWEGENMEYIPVMYLRKPQFVDQEYFDNLVSRMQIKISPQDEMIIWDK
jgi:hypothetical protein